MSSRLVALTLALGGAGCSLMSLSTTPITTQSGTPVPASRIYRPELALPSTGHTSKVSFLRDAGMVGGACTHRILVDREAAFGIRSGKYQTLYLTPGSHMFALEIEEDICPQFFAWDPTFLADGSNETLRILIPSPRSGPRVASIHASTGEVRRFWGDPAFEWDSAYFTPGTSLSLKESRRYSSSSGTSVLYELRAVGFSASESSTLWLKQWSSYDEVTAPIDENGRVNVLGTPSFGIEDFVPGQAVDLALVSGDRRAHAKTIPFPIAAKEGDYWASVEVMSESGLLFQNTFGSFQSGEKVEATSQHEGERLVATIEASGKGEVVFPVQFDQGDRGTATTTATGRKGGVSIQYKVGRDAIVPQ